MAGRPGRAGPGRAGPGQAGTATAGRPPQHARRILGAGVVEMRREGGSSRMRRMSSEPAAARDADACGPLRVNSLGMLRGHHVQRLVA
jgi:hypothetical protein